MAILILPLAVATIFCFAFVLMQPSSVRPHSRASRARTARGAGQSTGDVNLDSSLLKQFDPLSLSPDDGQPADTQTPISASQSGNGHAAKSQGNALTNLQNAINGQLDPKSH